MGSKPSTPKFSEGSALAEQNRLNQAAGYQTYANINSPMGGYSVSVDPDTGQMTVNKVLSDNSNAALAQQRAILANYSGDSTDAANAYYNARMAYLQPQMQRQVTRGQTALTNRGIPIGGSAWNEYMGDIYDAQNQQLAGVGSSALSAGQNYQTNMLGQSQIAGNMVIDPTLIQGAGGAGMYDTYLKDFENQKQRYQTDVANSNGWGNALGTAGGIIGGVIGGIFGGPGGAAMGAQAGTSAGRGIGGIADNS